MASPGRQRGVQNQCGHCGTHVSHDFARVFGDNEGTVHRCPSCAVAKSIYAGAAESTIHAATGVVDDESASRGRARARDHSIGRYHDSPRS